MGSRHLAAPRTPTAAPSRPEPSTHIVILHAQGDIQHAHLHRLHQSLLHVEQRFSLHLPGDGGAAHPPLSLLRREQVQPRRRNRSEISLSLSPPSNFVSTSCQQLLLLPLLRALISSLANQRAARSCTGSWACAPASSAPVCAPVCEAGEAAPASLPRLPACPQLLLSLGVSSARLGPAGSSPASSTCVALAEPAHCLGDAQQVLPAAGL